MVETPRPAAEEDAAQEPPPPPSPRPTNYLQVEVSNLSNVPTQWGTESGKPPDFAEHLFLYELEVMLPATRAAAQAACDVPAEGTGDVPCIFKHTFTHGRYHNLTNDVLRKVDKATPALPQLCGEEVAVEVGGPSPLPSKRKEDAQPPPPAPEAGSAPATPEPPSLESECEPRGVLWLWPRPEEPEETEKGKPTKGVLKESQPVEEAPCPKPSPDIPNFVYRLPLDEDLEEAISCAMEEGRPVIATLRRVLGPKAPPEWEDANEARYRGRALLGMGVFAEPGVEVWKFANTPVKPLLHEEPKPEEKKKKPPPKKGAKGAAPPAFLVTEEEWEVHPYVACETKLTIRMGFAKALVCLPGDRPLPETKPSDIVPRRVCPRQRPPDAAKMYSQEVQAIVLSLVTDYRMHRKTVQGEEESEEDIRKGFLQYISTSGRSYSYRQKLKHCVLRLVKEKFNKKEGTSKSEMELFCNDLYVYLLDQMHYAINGIFTRDQLAPPKPVYDTTSASDKWLRLATEAEVVKEHAVADKYHQERLVHGPSGSDKEKELTTMWVDYAKFALRVRDTAKAEQAFKEAIALDITHLDSLVGYGCLLLSRERAKEAEVFLQAAVDVKMDSEIAWGLLALYYQRVAMGMPQDEERGRKYCSKWAKYARKQALSAMEGEVPSREGDEPPPESPTENVDTSVALDLRLARYTLELHLEDLAEHSLSNAREVLGDDAVDVILLQSRKQFQLGVLEGPGSARDWLENHLMRIDRKNHEGLLLLGDVYTSLGDREVSMVGADGTERQVPAVILAEEYYDRALRIDELGAPGPVYIRLGNIYNTVGRYKDAKHVFICGAKVWPCGLAWMGIGIACYRMDLFDQAEQALNESNLLNNLNPRTWAYLCLVCLRQGSGREEEADQAFFQALKLGLDDAALLAEIGIEQQAAGRPKLAEGAFQKSLKWKESAHTRYLLAGSMVTMKRYDEAKAEYKKAIEGFENEAERAKAVKELEALDSIEMGEQNL